MKVFNIFCIFLIIILLFVSVGLGLLLVQSNNINKALQEENDTTLSENDNNTVEEDSEVSEEDMEDSDTVTAATPTTVSYGDSSIGLSFDFPSTWSVGADFDLVDDGSGTDRLLDFYKVELTKGTSALAFRFVFLATGIYGSTFLESEYEIVELGNNVLRTKAAGEDLWVYAQKIECTEMTGFAEYCGLPAFRSSTDRIYGIVLNSNDAAVIEEADGIALSSIN